MCYLYHSLQKTESKRKNKSGTNSVEYNYIIINLLGFLGESKMVRERERELERKIGQKIIICEYYESLNSTYRPVSEN